MESHKRTLGIIFVVSAVFQAMFLLLLSFFISFIINMALADVRTEDAALVDFIMKIVQFVPAFVIVFSLLPSLIAGIALLTRQSWGLTFAMIVGCLKLFSFPFGTAIGIYALWIFFEDKKITTAAGTQI